MKNINELQALNNAIENLNLKGYQVLDDEISKKPRYCFRTPEGKCLTGWWYYSEINHFIMGYGKAFNKFKTV